MSKPLRFCPLAASAIAGVLSVLALAGCNQSGVTIAKSPSDVEEAIRAYYASKYPSFAQLQALSKTAKTSQDSVKRGEKLLAASPVAEIVNSYPRGPYLSFEERTEHSKTTIIVTTVELTADDKDSCRVVIRSKRRDKRPGDAFSTLQPIREDEIPHIVAASIDATNAR
ncbi:MAG: hypothetical protein LLG00_09550 [Planctomycetaceae bacterium]|nr:hypothetical protein [Planctomycetaceae bacterium]